MHSTNDKPGNWMTAKEMAFLPHNLSEKGMKATRAAGSIWQWSDHFSVWACTGL